MTSRRNRASLGLGATLLLLLGVLTSCGNGSGNGTVASSGVSFDWAEAVDGLALSGPLTSFVAANESWAAVVDGGIDSTSSGRGSLRVFSNETGPEGQEFALPGDTRRALPFTWQTGDDEIAVVSAACPLWKAGSPPPAFNRDDVGPEWLQRGCGNSTFDLWTWNRSDQQWREVATGLFTSSGGVNISSTLDERLIVSFTPPVTDPERMTLNEFHLIDAAKGTMSPLPAPPDDPHITYIEQCFTADGDILMGASATRWADEEGVISPGDEGPTVDLFILQGDDWHPVEIDYPAATVFGCEPEGGLVIGRYGSIALVSTEEGRITSQEVLTPDGITNVEHRLGGTTLFQTDSDGVTTISTLVDRTWKDLGPVRDNGPWYVVADGIVEFSLNDEATSPSPIEARS